MQLGEAEAHATRLFIPSWPFLEKEEHDNHKMSSVSTFSGGLMGPTKDAEMSRMLTQRCWNCATDAVQTLCSCVWLMRFLSARILHDSAKLPKIMVARVGERGFGRSRGAYTR